MIDLDTVIANSKSLAPLPESSTRLASLFGEDDWDLDDVAEIVRLDGPLTGRVLSLVNSATSGSQTQISDIQQALIRLGPGTVLALALGAAAKQELNSSLAIYGLSEGDLWRHSVAVALAVEQARVVLRCSTPPEAFAAALLHDIGRLVLGRTLNREDVDYVMRSHDDGHMALIGAEGEILGVHHGEVGRLIAESWKLPEVIIEGIAHHHDPLNASSDAGRKVADLVALGDAVAREIGYADPEPAENLDPGVIDRLSITDELFAELCERVEQRFEDVLAVYG